MEITANILQYQDDKGEYLVEKIRDAAGQKGTGKWTAISALTLGMPVTLIGMKYIIIVKYIDTPRLNCLHLNHS